MMDPIPKMMYYYRFFPEMLEKNQKALYPKVIICPCEDKKYLKDWKEMIGYSKSGYFHHCAVTRVYAHYYNNRKKSVSNYGHYLYYWFLLQYSKLKYNYKMYDGYIVWKTKE